MPVLVPFSLGLQTIRRHHNILPITLMWIYGRIFDDNHGDPMTNDFAYRNNFGGVAVVFSHVASVAMCSLMCSKRGMCSLKCQARWQCVLSCVVSVECVLSSTLEDGAEEAGEEKSGSATPTLRVCAQLHVGSCGRPSRPSYSQYLYNHEVINYTTTTAIVSSW